jgi:hypothetical protein
MRSIEPSGRLREQDERRGGCEPAVALERRLEVLPGQQLHHDVGQLVGRGRVEHPHDVIALDRARELGLAREARAQIRARQGARQQHLEGPLAAGALVGDLVERAEATPADGSDDAVATCKQVPLFELVEP